MVEGSKVILDTCYCTSPTQIVARTLLQSIGFIVESLGASKRTIENVETLHLVEKTSILSSEYRKYFNEEIM